jgi:hypothetical protein
MSAAGQLRGCYGMNIVIIVIFITRAPDTNCLVIIIIIKESRVTKNPFHIPLILKLLVHLQHDESLQSRRVHEFAVISHD